MARSVKIGRLRLAHTTTDREIIRLALFAGPEPPIRECRATNLPLRDGARITKRDDNFRLRQPDAEERHNRPRFDRDKERATSVAAGPLQHGPVLTIGKEWPRREPE
jgi:hypothetical protein